MCCTMSYLESSPTRQPRVDYEVNIEDTGMLSDTWKKAKKGYKKLKKKAKKKIKELKEAIRT